MFFRIIVLLVFVGGVTSWNLEYYGISDNYFVSSIAVYLNRAFLALPRSVCFNNITYPTLIDVNWVGDLLIQPITSTHFRKRPIDQQDLGNCEHIQDAISLAIEHMRAQLWILDKGNDDCTPKLVSYSLLRNSLHDSISFDGVPSKKLNSIVIDSAVNEYGPMAYIAQGYDNSLLMVDLRRLKWWKIILMDSTETLSKISLQYLDISKVNHAMYMTGKSPELYTFDIMELRQLYNPSILHEEVAEIELNITYVGDKLGKSSGLISDVKMGLTYYLIRDSAIVRWDTNKAMQAESHEIIIQSSELFPYVSQLFYDAQNGVWALVNLQDEEECHHINTPSNAESVNKSGFYPRAVKVLKFSRREKKVLLFNK